MLELKYSFDEALEQEVDKPLLGSSSRERLSQSGKANCDFENVGPNLQ